MPTLHIKPKRHECSVNGCRNHDSYLVSKSPEHINAIYLCGEDIIYAFVLLAERITEHGGSQPEYYDLLHDPRTMAAIAALYGARDEPEDEPAEPIQDVKPFVPSYSDADGKVKYLDAVGASMTPEEARKMREEEAVAKAAQTVTNAIALPEKVIEPKPRSTYPPRRTRK